MRHEVTGVIDWEWAHAGDPVEDLAWSEWIIRMHHPEEVPALTTFFGAYGHRPPWAVRQQAMIAQARALLVLSEAEQSSGADANLWQQRVRITESWTQ